MTDLFRTRLRRKSSSLAPSDRLCDWMVFSLAAWTLTCNAVVLFGGGLKTLLFTSAATVFVVAACLVTWRNVSDADAASTADSGTGAVDPAAHASLATGVRIFGVTASALLVAAAIYGLDYRVVWLLAVLVLGFALSRLWRPAAPITPEARPSWSLATWLLATVGALFPLFVHRTSLDDTYYVNVAVAAVDSPNAALLRFDTLHGIADLPIMFPIYQINSYELLAAALSYLSPLSAIQAAHWVLPALFGGFVVLAYARLLQLLMPRAWFPSLLVVLAVFLTVAETSSFHANFAFVRLQQGKAVFLSVLIPLLLVYGVRFANRPSWRGFWLLTAAQIASLGLTATAIWLGPATAALALAARLPVDLRGIRVFCIGLLASVYPLAAGLFFRAEQTSRFGSFQLFPDTETMLRFGTREILGEGVLAVSCWGAILCAWCFAQNLLASRVCVVFSLGFLIVLYNPFIATPLADWVTGQLTHNRTFWVLPIPSFLAMIAIAPLAMHPPLWLRAPLELLPAWAMPALRIGVVVGAVAAFLFAIPTLHLLTERNRVRFEPLGLKVGAREYEIARIIAERAPTRSWVLAPEEISRLIVMFHEHPYPLTPRKLYLDLMKGGIAESERAMRWALTEYVGGTRQIEGGQTYLLSAIDHFKLGAVGVAHSAWSKAIGRTLSARGYREHYSGEVYSLWLRDVPKRGSETPKRTSEKTIQPNPDAATHWIARLAMSP